jgi:hypothetical protein
MLSQLSMANGENTEYHCLDIIMNKRYDFCTARTYDTVLSRPVVSHTTPYATCLANLLRSLGRTAEPPHSRPTTWNY